MSKRSSGTTTSPFLEQGRQDQGRHIYRAARYGEAEVEALLASGGEEIIAVADSERRRLTSSREVLEFYQDGFSFQVGLLLQN